MLQIFQNMHMKYYTSINKLYESESIPYQPFKNEYTKY